MDQLVDPGSRAVEGMAAVHGEMLHRLKVLPNPEMGDLIQRIPIFHSTARRKRGEAG